METGAGATCGLNSMSRLSQESISNSGSTTGKHSNLSPTSGLNSVAATQVEGKKKAQKRKSLSSRYTAGVHPKRRKLGLSAIKDPSVSHNEPATTATTIHNETITTTTTHHERTTGVLGLACSHDQGSALNQPNVKKKRGRPKTRPTPPSGGLETNTNILPKAGCTRDIDLHASYLDGNSNSNLNAEVLTIKGNCKFISPKVNVLTKSNTINNELKEKSEADLGSERTTPFLPVNGKVKLKSKNSRSDKASLNPKNEQISKPKSGGILRKSDLANLQQQPSRGWDNLLSSKQPFKPEKLSIEIRTVTDHETAHSSNSELATNPSFTASEVQGSLVSCSTTEEGAFSDGRNLRPRRHPKRETENRLLPTDYVGKRVVVYWPHAKAWFAGTVIEYDDSRKKHHIKYDDNDEEYISFRRHKVMLEVPPAPQSGAAPYPTEGELSFTGVASEGNKKEARHEQVVEVEGSTSQQENKLSAFLSCNQLKENCNGSVRSFVPDSIDDNNLSKHVSPDLSVCHEDDNPVENRILISQEMPDVPAYKGDQRQELHEKSVPPDHSGRAGAFVDAFDMIDGDGVRAAAFVYVRRQKRRHKDESARVDDRQKGSGSEGVHDEQKDAWRCDSLSMVQQSNLSDFPDTPQSTNVNYGVNITDVGLQDHPFRKRNKRSLKKLVSIVKGKDTSHERFLVGQSDSGHDGRVRKRARKRRGKKRKLCSSSSPTASIVKIASLASSPNAHLNTPALSNETEHTQFSEQKELVSEVVTEKLELCDHFPVHKIHTAFHFTISLMLPMLTPDLFTWQFFNILVGVGFCNRGSFDGRFSTNGSVQDLVGIFRLLLAIIKSMPASSWVNQRCPRQWQNSILYKLWTILAGIGPPCRDKPLILSKKAERVLMRHLQIITGEYTMTSRLLLNFFACYFIRPYITATLCDKGAVFRVAIHQILLLDQSRSTIAPNVRQSLKSVQLRSGAVDADKSFSSYLVLFPLPDNWLAENGIFLKQMQDWVDLATEVGYVEQLPPVPSVKFVNHMGIQITAAHLASRGFTPNHKRNKSTVSRSSAAYINNSCSQDIKFSNGFCKIADMYSVLLTISMFQKNHIEFARADQYLVQGLLKLQMILNIERENEVCTEELNQNQDVGGTQSATVGGDPFPIQVKIEPDTNVSVRSSSITTESNTAGLVKEESSVEMYGQNGISVPDSELKDNPYQTTEGQLSTRIDDYYGHKRQKDGRKSKRGRPRRGEQERRPRPQTTRYCIADILFTTGDTVWRESGARVEVRLNPSTECVVTVHHDGKTYRQKVVEGSTLACNPAQLIWKSDNDWSLEFVEREQWDVFRRIYNDLVQRISKVVNVKSLPIPFVRLVEESEPLDPLGLALRPPYAIRHPDDEIQSALKNDRILYDLDSEDEDWLVETNILSRGRKEDGGITEDVFEQIIDRLEKEAYRMKEESVPISDAVQACEDIGSADVVRAVHSYWSMKRSRKGKALLRHFQPPPREQYEKELKVWEAKMEQCPPEQRDSLLQCLPRPRMSAFCLQSRGLDGADKSKKMLRQRSQKKLKPSRSSSEDSQRPPVYWFEDPVWYPHHYEQTKSPAYTTGGVQQSSSRSQFTEPVSERVDSARSRAVAARKTATATAAKFQRRFLNFDAALQSAWAFLIEYQAVIEDEDSPLSEEFASNMEHLFGRCSSLLVQDDDSSDDEPPLLGSHASDIGQEFLDSFTRKCSIENKLENEVHLTHECEETFLRQDLHEEASPLLPISTKGYPYAWIGSTLLQKPDNPE